MKRPALVLVGLTALSGCRKSNRPADPEHIAEPLPVASSPIVEHCTPTKAAPFVLKASASKHSDTDPGGAEDTPSMLPFAAEIGGGTRWSGGFAVGAIHAPEGSPTLAIVTLGPEGERPRIFPLGVAHGDVEPPRVVARDDEIVFGILESQPNGRALRIGKIKADDVLWGATFPSRSGESQAFDLSTGENVVATWDEERPSASVVQVVTIDPKDLVTATPPRTVSPPDRDADSPRLVSRPGGYWLAYIAHREVDTGEDAAYLAENVGVRWVELLPLDHKGSPCGNPRSVTPTEGHVMLYDMSAGPDGGAMIVWRELDTSTGSAGGRIMRVVARPSAVEPPTVLVDSDVGTGAPSLVGRWLAITDAADATRIAPVSPLGEILRPPAREPEIGVGEPIAAIENTILVARPLGRDMRLSVVHCQPEDLAPSRVDTPQP